MAMLAEPRRKQKWTLNPRGKQWSDDSNKFGQKMLEKMGWSSGKGLGANEQGMTEHVRVKFKDDSGGIGYSKDNLDKNWTEHQESFNDLLQKLASAADSETPTTSQVKESDLSGKSLELKSRQSRARVHYRKFTRGKDVNKYSAKDLANIFGKKDMNEKVKDDKAIEEAEADVVDPIGSADRTGGVLTLKGGNMSDYFKNKMPLFSSYPKKNIKENDESEGESERYVGFGFSSGNSSELPKETDSYAFVNPALDLKETSNDNTPRKRKSEFYLDNPALDLNNETKEQASKKRKTDFSFENQALDTAYPDSSISGKKKMMFVKSENDLGQAAECIQQDSENVTDSNKKKKKKKKKDNVDGYVNDVLDLEIEVKSKANGEDFEVLRPQSGLANCALDLTDESSGKKRVTFNDKVEYSTDCSKKKTSKVKLDKFEVDNEKLKKKKKKKRDVPVPEEVNVFVNEALDVEIVNEEINDNEANERKSKKSKRKRNKRMSNLETIEEAPEEDKDESAEITNESSEPPKKKKKNNENKNKNDLTTSTLDVMEIDTIAKKLKKEQDVTEMENVCSAEEPKKKHKKKRKVKEILEETVKPKNENVKDEIVEEENSNKENAEDVVESDGGKKKSKKCKRSKKSKGEVAAVSSEEFQEAEKEQNKHKTPTEVVKNTCDAVVEENVQSSPSQRKSIKPKKMFKALFSKSPILHFAGSNINEIKGYGVDV